MIKLIKEYWIIAVIMIVGFGLKTFFEYSISDSNSNDNSDSNISRILSKNKNELTIHEWKKIADYRASEYYECAKGLALDLSSLYLSESCATEYSNSWVLFRNGLDHGANLNHEEIKLLKDYFNKTRYEMIEKVGKENEENEKKLRPKKYN